ncbi:hypothetical protein [Arthrobacter celericrescens]|uniref:hypothetical protein n=1 Tax=Arthrobacter celericrescens TaxID=2320851 RepID=UPI000EA3B0B7|nr:hypothetical protein [Arthrobacter celericrescens]
MAAPHFGRFLAEATIPDLDPARWLAEEQLFGLYLSWCSLERCVPLSEAGFRAGMKRHGVRPSATGLRRTGPAAMDYILHTYPALP